MYLESVLEKAEDHPYNLKQLEDMIDSSVAWITWDQINEIVTRQLESFGPDSPSMDGSGSNSWMDKYIFPGGYIPTVTELITQMGIHNFYLLDAESLRNHYTRTLEDWAENYEQALPLIRESKDETFIRMWRLYLNSCAAAFHSGNIDLHQFLFSKGPTNCLPSTRDYICA